MSCINDFHRKELISVIIPVYNVEKYLRRCVESVMRQTYPSLEIILVDDGSTDSSPILAEELAREDRRIQVYHKKNGGLSSARNYALDRCHGTFLTFVDSDDWIHPKTYENALRSLCVDDSDVCCWGCFFEGNGQRRMKRPVLKKEVVSPDVFFRKLFLEESVDHVVWNKMYRSRIYEGIRFPEGYNYEDGRTTYKVIRKAQKISLLPFVGYHYNQTNVNSITGRCGLKNSLDHWTARYELYREFGKENEEFREAILSRCLQTIAQVWAERYKEPAYEDPRIQEIRDFIEEKKYEIGHCKKSNGSMRCMILQIPKLDKKMCFLFFWYEQFLRGAKKVHFLVRWGGIFQSGQKR